jgi:FkbM family methyltransferase
MNASSLLRLGVKRFLHEWLKQPARINGKSVRLPRELLPFFSIRNHNVYEPEVCDFLAAILASGDIMVDVGANAGMISLFASKAVGAKGHVFSFEPNPTVYALMTKLLAVNDCLGNATPLSLAASNVFQKFSLHVSTIGSPTLGRSSVVHADPDSIEQVVLGVPLDSFEPMLGAVRVIKIDVEGFEAEVIEGALRLLSCCHPILCVEIHGLYFKEPAGLVERVFNLLEGLGYKCWNLCKRRAEGAIEFLKDTGFPGSDPLSGKEFRTLGYGQLVFACAKDTPLVNAFFQKETKNR